MVQLVYKVLQRIHRFLKKDGRTYFDSSVSKVFKNLSPPFNLNSKFKNGCTFKSSYIVLSQTINYI